MIWLSFLLLTIGLALLGGASRVAISNLVAISEKRRLRKSVLSFLLVAISTSLPELIVAINAIALNNMSVSLGDILGSNITNVSLVIGLCLIVVNLNKSQGMRVIFKEEDKREFKTGLLFLSITLLTLLYLQYVGNIVGILLLALFFAYSYVLLQKRKEIGDDELGKVKDKKIIKELALTIAGIVGVIFGASLTIDSAVEIATFFGVPASIIGATLIAFGTSLPELSVDLRAAYGGFFEIAMGDIVGSCFMNSTLILGLLLLFTPFRVNIVVLSDLILFSVVSNIVLWYFLDIDYLGRRGGMVLLTIYLVNLLSLLGILILRVP